MRLGLTGSIAMGKSATAAQFRALGVPVYDADAAAHRVYAAGGAAGPAVRAIAPEAVGPDGAVDREALKRRVKVDSSFLPRLEAIVHPLVAEARASFEAEARAAGARLAVYDVPLLFETGLAEAMDAVLVVSAPEAVQRARALGRAGLTEAMLDKILERQTPDAEKRARADFVLDTSKGHDHAKAEVERIVKVLLSG
ncbi:MAG: dephospho-CoA kinase [Pseudomonadota bacterium]